MGKNQILFFLIFLISLLGCSEPKKSKEVLVKINGFEMSPEDFEEDLKNDAYGFLSSSDQTQFLNVSIDKQLLIQEAQRRGLHQKKSFLKTIERYWEQTLIKELLDSEAARIRKNRPEAEQEKALQDWILSLRQNADIKINEDLLKKYKKSARPKITQ